jgi:general secretion pathway protein F
MPAFRFEAADETGRITKGVMEADSERHARQLVRERGLSPLLAELVQVEGKAGGGAFYRRRLSATDLTLCTRQLANLIGARLPMEQSLAALIEQSEKPAMREVWAAVRSRVTGGSGLAAAMAEHPKEFDPVYRALISAGEVLQRLADYLETRGALKSKVVAALAYPAIVTVIAVVIVIGLMTYVVPQVVGVFTSTKQALPILTQILVWLSAFLIKWGWLLLIVLVAGGWLLIRTLKQPAVKARWHAKLLTLPVIGPMVRALETERFASTLAILVSGGVPLLRALEAAQKTINNVALNARVLQAIGRVREGATLARALQSAGNEKSGAKFPPVLIHLISSGEQTGDLPAMLGRAADIQSRELERRTVTLTALLEPALIVGMGGLVLLIVLAVLMPIIEINSLVK